MDLTRKKICELYQGLESLLELSLPVEIAFDVAFNKRQLAQVIESIEEAIKPLPSEEDRNNERNRELIQLARKHKAKSENGVWNFPDPVSDDVLAFHQKYEDVELSLMDRQAKKQKLMMDTSTSFSFELRTIPFEELKKLKVVKGSVIDQVMDIISE